jgi:hypothetical protein
MIEHISVSWISKNLKPHRLSEFHLFSSIETVLVSLIWTLTPH